MEALAQTWHSLTAAWVAVHVERQGKYSLERLRQLHDYQRSTSLTRAWTIIVLTPLPCLVIVSLLDAIPLESPSRGLEHSHTFWLRWVLSALIVFVSLTTQIQPVVPRLPVAAAHIVWIPSVVALSTVTLTFAAAWVIGYPLPFIIVLCSPVACTSYAVCIYVAWGIFLSENADTRGELVNYFVLVLKLASLLFVYALFGYAFNSLSSIGQTAFAVLLPILKLACKNWIGSSVREIEDLKPEMIIFNVEIFHALNVAFSMQNAASIHTIAVLMVLDFFHAVASLRHFHRIARAWTTDLTTSTSSIPVDSWKLWTRGRVAPLRVVDALTETDPPQLLRIILMALETHEKVASSPRPPVRSYSVSRGPPSRRPGSLKTETSKDAAFETSKARVKKSQSLPKPPTTVATTKIRADVGQQPPNVSIQILLTPTITDEKHIFKAPSARKLREQSQSALQLLHMTEFFVLVEYTEVMIPILYCLYLLVMRHLPNRVYYAQLKDVDDAKLQQNIGNILLYAFLELVSFLVLSWYLGSKLRISAIHQLAFVLEHQWHMVQSKFIVWVVLTVQSSLEHFGADYSFQFKWLHQQ